MERSEPALAPEWLKSSGNVSGGGNENHQVASSSLQSDDHAISKSARKKTYVSIYDHDTGRLFASDQPSSSYLRRSSSSNGSAHLRSYSSSGRSPREMNRKDIYNHQDKDKPFLGALRHRDYLDPLDDILPSRFEKDMLRRSQSVITGKRSETGPRIEEPDSNNTNKSIHSNVNGVFGGGSIVSSVHKAAFDRNFPSLGVEDIQRVPELGRVSSPGLSTAVQGSETGNSGVSGGPGRSWALAEVIENNGMSNTSVDQTVSVNSASAPSMFSLNMAETLAHGPARARTAPQSPVGTQRLEELAIIQSRLLIPMTPSMPKALVPSPSEKAKLKIVQQQYQISSSHLANHTPRGGPTRSDVPRTSNIGKLHVLKPARERNEENSGVSPTARDESSPTSGNKAGNHTFVVPSLAAGSAPLRSASNNSNIASSERKPAAALVTGERKPTSQAQSRNDFFNLMRKKSFSNAPAIPDPVPAMSPSVPVNSDELITDLTFAPVTSQVGDAPLLVSSVGECSAKNLGDTACSGDACDGYLDRDRNSSNDAIFYSEKEEAAFLRSLGWEEHDGEDEGLTEEEISAFYKEYMKLRPSSKLQGIQPNNPVLLNSDLGRPGGASSGFQSSVSGSES